MADFKKVTLALATAGLLSSGAVQAALIDRGGGLIYDDVLNITWLADANYAQTSGYDSDGRMNWSTANTWAANLSYGGYDDWRLPSALSQDGSRGICFGYCTNSEMGHMFYNNLGAIADSSVLAGTDTANLALFTNLQSYLYWFGTVDALDPAGYAFLFFTLDGYQDYLIQDFELYAWAVRPGDVAAIPEPETYAMLLAGLGLLGVAAKWRRRSFGAS
ncbi:MAG: PEP-CTERM sorting domain-containing protein [Nitrosomonas sp.]|nr:PEP-CTERM sorting domain-containing protein [Nitrosomonas sp.]